MSKEKQNDELVQMYRDLAEIFDEEYEKRRLITPQNTAEKMTAKGYRKQSEGEWKQVYYSFPRYACTNCNHLYNNKEYKYCPNCGAKMRKEDEGK